MDRSERSVHIELLRILACFLVIVNHTNSALFQTVQPSPTWFASLAYFFACKAAVPVFLMIMGAVLLGKEDTPRRWRQRLLRGFVVFAASSAACYVYYGWAWRLEIGLGDFLRKLPYLPATNAYWYLYLYLGILCMLPVLQRLAKALGERELRWVLLLSVGVLGLDPVFRAFFRDFHISGYFNGALLGTRLAMVLYGYYVERYVTPTRQRALAACVLFPVLVLVQVAATYHFYQRDPDHYLMLDNIDSVLICASAVCVYEAVRYASGRLRLGERARRGICYLGSLTFGIYLLHEVVVNATRGVFASLWTRMDGMAAMVLWELMVFTVCAAAAAVGKKIPFLGRWL